jgi:Concanavalin A-like lectin/glucanases superfamily
VRISASSLLETLVFSAALVVSAALACSPSPTADEATAESDTAQRATAEQAAAERATAGGAAAAATGSGSNDAALPAGRGWVVWESDRGGAARIWRRALQGGAEEQLSPEEPGRDHCCAHLSPDGSWVVYLSIPGGLGKYSPAETLGELHLIPSAGGRDRVLVSGARHYGGHRSALWWSEDELVYIAADGDTRLHDLSTGAERRIADGPERGEGFLVDPTGRWATSSTATFSEVDPATGKVRLATPFSGCEAWLAADGKAGIWTAGAGGPIDAVDLATRSTWTVLAKHDPRLPADRGYIYFPMLSRDRTLLAVAGSNDDHDHFRADYDVFVVELDPDSLLPISDALRVTAHPGVDRYPDVWRDPASSPRRAAPARRPPPRRAPPGEWPTSPAGLAWVWEGAERPNRRAPDAAAEILTEHGETWTDRRGRLALAGGFAAADPESAARTTAELRGSNTVTVEMVLEPASLRSGVAGPILALSAGPRQRGILVTQNGDRIELVLRTNETPRGGGAPALLARLPGAGPHHLAWSYSPGRLRTYLDGQPVGSPQWSGDFYPWRAGELTIGSEGGGPERFRGWVSHVAILARELTADEIAADAREALGAIAAAPRVAQVELEGVLEARSRIPTLDQISPYRRALVVERFRVERIEAGELEPGTTTLRVARWALLDGTATAASALAPGARVRLRLEPYDAQPQLEAVFLSMEKDDPGADGASRAATGERRLWFDVGL